MSNARAYRYRVVDVFTDQPLAEMPWQCFPMLPESMM